MTARPTSRAALVPAVAAALALWFGACGGSGSTGSTKADPSSSQLAGLRVDQDADGQGGGYYDGDDAEVASYGTPASAAQARAIASVVKSYYAAAAAGQAQRACALTYFVDAETLPESYGQPAGPRWLHGVRTCTQMLAGVFAHFHRELTVPATVVAVRVRGEHADALVGFSSLPAGFVRLHREGAAWKVDGLLASPLP